MSLSAEVLRLLAELRDQLPRSSVYVSDRRWVKVAGLLKMAAASEGRPHVSLWDLWLLPWCVAPDAERQAALDAWLAGRLGIERRHGAAAADARRRGVRGAGAARTAKPRTSTTTKSGRLKFTTEIDEHVGRRQGRQPGDAHELSRASAATAAPHIDARLRQVDELIERIGRYAETIAARRAELAAYSAQSLWLDPISP